MIYDEKHNITLSDVCYYIKDYHILKGELIDFDHLIDNCPRPHGVGYSYYPTTVKKQIEAVFDDDDNEIEPAKTVDVWCLARYKYGKELVIEEFETEEEAQRAAEKIYIHDILNSPDECVFLSLDDAINTLEQVIENEMIDGSFEVNKSVYVMTREAVEAEQKEWYDEDENKNFDFSTHPYWLMMYGECGCEKGYYTIKELIEGALID